MRDDERTRRIEAARERFRQALGRLAGLRAVREKEAHGAACPVRRSATIGGANQPKAGEQPMQKVQATGIPWYRREHYPRILEIMTDGRLLPRTHREWLQKAELVERQVEAAGAIPVRAEIDPDQFSAWCVERGLKINADARTRFASEAAFRHLTERAHE